MDWFGPFVLLLMLGVVFWFVILLPAGMADRRGRSQLVWVLISIFGSPILAILLLWALGNAPEGHTR